MMNKILKWTFETLTFSRVRFTGLFFGFHGLFNYLPRESMIIDAISFASISQIEGDYLEFGVFEGYSFARAHHTARASPFQCMRSMRFYAFDSFEGLPEITGKDATYNRYFSKGDCRCDYGTFMRNIRRWGVNMEAVTVVRGWYADTLNEKTKSLLPIKKAAVIMIDCDLYESTKPVFDFITDYVQDGTVIIFDDWFLFRGRSDRGEQRAFYEWLKKNPRFSATHYRQFAVVGNSFIIHENIKY